MRETLLSCASLLLAACQAFEPTIPDRQREPRVQDPRTVALSLAEEHPALLAGPAPAPEAQSPAHPEEPPAPPIGDGSLLSVEFRDARLGQVVHFLAQEAGINILLDPALDRQVDVSFPSVTLDAALRAVLAEHDLELALRAPGIYAVEPADGSRPAAASFRVQSIDAGEVRENLERLVGAGQVVIDAPQNLVLVRGSQADVEAVADYLELADQLKRQVLIEVRILEVHLTEDLELGVSAAINDGTIDGSLIDVVEDLATPDESFEVMFQSESGKVDAAIQAIRELTGIDLVSSPRVLAMTGAEAKIEVLTEVPYINVTNTTISDPGTGTGTNVIQEVQFKEAGITMTVTPTILGGGAVRIKITTVFSEVVGEFNAIPIIDQRELTSDFLVRDRHTVVLGGLMQDQRTETDKGVPGLMEIPWLGRLFRSDVDDLEKRELLVFLTPRIVDDDEAGRLTEVLRGSYSERRRRDGVRPVSER